MLDRLRLQPHEINNFFVDSRRKLGSSLLERTLKTATSVSRLHPDCRRPHRVGAEVRRDVAYLETGLTAHTLDVYRPKMRDGLCPTVLYVHGGGFRILSKESHWMPSTWFAREGYVVFTINYRLAPAHPFPAALEDTAAAFAWVLSHARAFGGDPSQIVLAGESAGANLITSLTLMTCFERPEPLARRVFDLGTIPRAVVGASGLYEVSNEERFWRDQRLSWFFRDRLISVRRGYLPDQSTDNAPLCLANPLVLLEQDIPPIHALPPFLLSAGTRDPIIDDTRRLEQALKRRGVPHEARYYEGEPHAFEMLLTRRAAKEAWRAAFRALTRIESRASLSDATSLRGIRGFDGAETRFADSTSRPTRDRSPSA